MTLLQILYSTPYRDLVSLSKGSKIHLEMLLYLVIIDLSYTFFVDICSLLIKLSILICRRKTAGCHIIYYKHEGKLVILLILHTSYFRIEVLLYIIA